MFGTQRSLTVMLLIGASGLFAQLKDALKYLEKNIPDLQKMAVAYMPLGTAEELRTQIIELALDRAFMADPLEMRSHYWYDHIRQMPEAAKARHVGDYLAGMTDAHAIRFYRRLFDPTFGSLTDLV